MQIQTSRKSGFTLVEIMIVVAIIGLLAAIAIPNFVKARETAQLNSIFNNLRILEGAKDQYALEEKKGTGDLAGWGALTNYLKGATVNTVVNETYNLNNIGTAASALISVKLGTYASGSTITAP